MVRVTSIMAWALLCGIGLGLGLWIVASALPGMSRPRLARRVAPYLVDVSAAARDAVAPPSSGPLPVFALLVDPVIARLRRLLGATLGGHEVIARRLRQSGSPLTVEGFRSRQLVWGLGGALTGAAVALAATAAPLPARVAMIVVLAAGGVLLRDSLLQRAARKRLARLAEELPVVLEFMTLSLAAGEGILDAVRRVSRVGSGELAGEFAQVTGSVSTGLPFGETLAELARDLELPALSRCVDQMLTALDRGSPLADVLRAQAQDSRDEAKRNLIEAAGKKEVGMLVPLVFLILPVTIVFAIWPGIFVLQVGF